MHRRSCRYDVSDFPRCLHRIRKRWEVYIVPRSTICHRNSFLIVLSHLPRARHPTPPSSSTSTTLLPHSFLSSVLNACSFLFSTSFSPILLLPLPAPSAEGVNNGL